jgi:hypothetical protein
MEGVKAEESGFLLKESDNVAMDYVQQGSHQGGHAAK